MVSELNQTPNAMRLQIAVFGRRNHGKSSIINALSGQAVAVVSDTPGTTTDPVFKAMEIYPLGPCVLIDTAGFDDEGTLGEKRVEKTRAVLKRADAALVIFLAQQKDFSIEDEWIGQMKRENIPVIGVLNKIDLEKDIEGAAEKIAKLFDIPVCMVSGKTGEGMDKIRQKLVQAIPSDCEIPSITGHLCGAGDHVLLVAPQDIQAPKGRLILPQVQTIRDLLDNKAVVTTVTTDQLAPALKLFHKPPKLVICDSQVFSYVYRQIPESSMLTSFSVLMARFKGDIEAFYEGAEAIGRLGESDKVLIAEACSHKPLDGDIGRKKIPALLRKTVGEKLRIEVVAGHDFPGDLSPYALVIHCGGCMFNRRYVLNRVAACKQAGVPITNYGIAIAKMNGILDKIRVVE